MPKTLLTIKTIESIKPEAGRRLEYWDEHTPNFGLRVTENGRKSFFLMYVFNGVKKRLTLGGYPALTLSEARQKARIAQHAIDTEGVDPSEEKKQQRKAETFEDLAERYIEQYAKTRKKSWAEDQRVLHREFLPKWKHYKANTITRRDVMCVLDEIYERGAHIQSNRALALIRKVFNFGINRDIIQINPCYQIQALAREKRRDRVLSDEEIKELWKEAEKESLKHSSYIKMLFLTAQRPGEVSNMKWSQIDLSNGWWTIPGEGTKNKLPHRVPLSPMAKQILWHLNTGSADSDWVFKSRGRDLPIHNFKKSLNRIRKNSSVSFTRHDIRRTVASKLASITIPRLTVKKILNHVESDVTAVYDRYSYDKEKKDALNAWEGVLKQILNDSNKKLPSQSVIFRNKPEASETRDSFLH